ncbi:RNA polymerase sigma factor [Arsenicitalea aurantiaca]|uniref:RNA polymerase sigma factor n=1 Tax=Arsenicitalea aurantiaca TaxID=1783274 RepID=A0A433XKW9_9HYPH|nr:RNA polymerase sigma factor [Arsenicitalea aurantiaca]RUT34725.1 RNA polymerase sigma factor [Arsenicitalea aurantiaca]
MTQETIEAARPAPEGTDWLLARARAGDRAAFTRLLELHYDLIFRTACKWSGRRSDAEDIAQDVCIKLATAIHSFDGRSTFTSWLYRVTLNAVRDMQRSSARHSRRAAALAAETEDAFPAEQEAAAEAHALWAVVRRLPDKQRDAVLLVYAEDLSHAEAATIMGCKEATVSWHIHEAKKTLRGLL